MRFFSKKNVILSVNYLNLVVSTMVSIKEERSKYLKTNSFSNGIIKICSVKGIDWNSLDFEQLHSETNDIEFKNVNVTLCFNKNNDKNEIVTYAICIDEKLKKYFIKSIVVHNLCLDHIVGLIKKLCNENLQNQKSEYLNDFKINIDVTGNNYKEPFCYELIKLFILYDITPNENLMEKYTIIIRNVSLICVFQELYKNGIEENLILLGCDETDTKREEYYKHLLPFLYNFIIDPSYNMDFKKALDDKLKKTRRKLKKLLIISTADLNKKEKKTINRYIRFLKLFHQQFYSGLQITTENCNDFFKEELCNTTVEIQHDIKPQIIQYNSLVTGIYKIKIWPNINKYQPFKKVMDILKNKKYYNYIEVLFVLCIIEISEKQAFYSILPPSFILDRYIGFHNEILIQ